jgi:hypothetical protein
MVLDGLYGTKLAQDLHLKLMDTMVFKKGDVAFLCYNQNNQKVKLIYSAGLT